VDIVTAATGALFAASLLVSLIAGFVFAFAVVVMPGLRELDDGSFIRAFQRIDGVIQKGDLLFGSVFLGATVALAAAVGLGIPVLHGLDRALLLAAGAIYVLGVLVPTGVVNVPLNNRLQRLDVDELGPEQRRAARRAFEPPWNRWNRIRTALACVSAAVLMLLLTDASIPAPRSEGAESSGPEVVVRRLIDAINRQDSEALRDVIHQDYVYRAPGEELHGIGGLEGLLSAYRQGFPDFQIVIDDAFGDQDRVAILFTFTGTHLGELMGVPPTGESVSVQGTILSRVADGKIVEEWELIDQLTMYQQLGMTESRQASSHGTRSGQGGAP
jgi:steroid delta-isomerase-like uncharacterized protein